MTENLSHSKIAELTYCGSGIIPLFLLWCYKVVFLISNIMSDSIATAVNLARKSTDDAPVSENFCSALLKRHLPADFEFPTDCRKFDSFKSGIVRRDSKQREEDLAFAGMTGVRARTARERGRPNQAQLIRRMSSRKQSKESSWF
mmetsp:Transcript_9210/g.22880  ORF Transcript_9210/g.22880 Transcript_9210/m.22880 type:complete len:145 (+) Transcript_9210:3-437(+)